MEFSGSITDLPNYAQVKSDVLDAIVRNKCENSQQHMVLYTDGGCRPTPKGCGGYGIHGYVYTIDKPKQGHGCKGFTPTARGYVNGTPRTNSDIQEVTVLKYIDGTGSIGKQSTNNEAEVVGLKTALNLVYEMKPETARFKLDSEYALRGCTEWLGNWISGNWKRADGSPVSNKGHWQDVHELLNKVTPNTTLSWEWVKGHSDSVGNSRADYNATCGVNAGRNDVGHEAVRVKDPKEYWKTDLEYNRMLAENQWYFGTHTDAPVINGKYIYHLGSHGPDDDMHGVPQSDAVFAVVALAEPVPVLEKVRAIQQRRAPSTHGLPVLGRLNTILKKAVHDELLNVGDLYLHRPSHKADLFTANDTVVTREMVHARKAFFAMEQAETLTEVLSHVLHDKLPVGYVLTDITDLIYEQVPTKKDNVYKVKLPTGDGGHAIKPVVSYYRGGETNFEDGEVKTIPLTLTVGVDTPKRNTFSGLAEQKPSVFVITWPEDNRSTMAFRYATIVKTEKDCGLWAGVYSNLRIMP